MGVINGISELPLAKGYSACSHVAFTQQTFIAGTTVQWISAVLPRLRGGVGLYGVMRVNPASSVLTGTLGTVAAMVELQNGWGWQTIPATNTTLGLSWDSTACVGQQIGTAGATFTLRPYYDSLNVDSRIPYFNFDNFRLAVGIPAGQAGTMFLDCNIYAIRPAYPTTGNFPIGFQGSVSAS